MVLETVTKASFLLIWLDLRRQVLAMGHVIICTIGASDVGRQTTLRSGLYRQVASSGSFLLDVVDEIHHANPRRPVSYLTPSSAVRNTKRLDEIFGITSMGRLYICEKTSIG